MTQLALAVLLTVGQADQTPQVEISPNPTVWETVTLTINGPEASESGSPNPFRDYRLDIEFTNQLGRSYRVPGFFAADGDAAESGTAEGHQWKVRFLPDLLGRWRYKVSFRTGDDVALADDRNAGRPVPLDGLTGEFSVGLIDWQIATGFRRHGRLEHRGRQYLILADSGRIFLKAGADSPENLLAYADFDGTRTIGGPQPKRDGESSRKGLHTYEPHVRDWKEGDPVWRNGKGKGLVGALNYLASQGVNSIYFLPMNVEGDGKDVWPWIAPDKRDRFDVSKLDQWGIVFDHADRLGIALHFVLTETENENLFEALDGPGDGKVPFADTRKLYYRELVARFGHHPAIVWNLGEENGGDRKNDNELAKGNTTAQRKAFAEFIRSHDSSFHPIVVHTYPGQYDKIYEPLLGLEHLDGPSLQMGNPKQSHTETLKWLRKSREAGRPWFVCIDEIGPADTGVVPDDASNASENHKLAREVLWGNLLAGGSGVEWYFGYKYPHNDLNLENFRSRENVWKFTKAAIDFFHEHLPFEQMESADELVKTKNAFCMAKPGEVYAVYLSMASKPITMNLPQGSYDVRWFDPIKGGELKNGSIEQVEGGENVSIGGPPAKPEQDWVVLVRMGETHKRN